MDVIKFILFLTALIPITSFSQEIKFPQDTIYVVYDNKTSIKKWNGNYGYGKSKKKGTLFNLKDANSQYISLFHECKLKSDTLDIKKLNNYKFLTLKEIRKKEIEWVERKYAKSKYKPYTGSKNAVFQTYLIEIISKEKFVIYPVIWRNEGVID